MSEHMVTTPADVAVIGMSCRLPGASDPDEFWRNLREGIESIRTHTVEELKERGVPQHLLDNPRYVRASAPLDGADTFDAAFFGYSPREAEVMDPQHRQFLECSYHALEEAGYDPSRYDGLVGVYAGSTMNTYLPTNLIANGEVVDVVGDLQIMIGNDKEYLASRVSYKLDLQGPSTVVQTACSTSLVAIHVAVQALLAGECDMALAGGSSVRMPLGGGYLHQPGGTSSPDGHCRAFDARAGGSVVGTGVGVVVLKHLDDALADGDHIYAVIKGTAINNDGAAKASFTAPSVLGQARAAAAALEAARVDAADIGFVEAHGTGTPLGDPIEVAALTMTFRESTQERQYCALGSAKTNIGHLDAAAGVAGFIKAVQTVRHGLIPPTLHFTTPNPQLKLESSPFYVNNELEEWEGPTPRRAAVNSIGMGGTNAHVVLEEPPAPPVSEPAERHQLLVLSARTPSALEASTARLARWLREHPGANLADVSHTLGLGRKALPHRRAVVVRDVEDAGYALEAPGSGRVTTRHAEPPATSVAFLFPGQGTQYCGMARRRYDASPAFRAAVDTCLSHLDDGLAATLRELLLARRPTEEDAERLRDTALAQPALFVVEYACAQELIHLGVKPGALLGHSVGEIVAATVAGTLPLPDALRLVATRGRLMSDLPPGAMIGVPLPEDRAAAYTGDGVEIAAVNAAGATTLAGPAEAVAEAARRLERDGVPVQRLHVSHAFHTAMMEDALDGLTAALDGVRLSAPAIPWISGVTGAWIAEDEATDPGYWARQARSTVRFADGCATLAAQPGTALVEAGPGGVLSAFARTVSGDWPAIAQTMGGPRERRDDRAVLLDGLGVLWSGGVDLDWPRLWEGTRRLRLSLPTYPFEPRRYWVTPAEGPRATAAAAVADDERRPSPADWWHLPVWESLPPLRARRGGAPVLVVSDGHGALAAELARNLTARGRTATVVDAGTGPVPGGALTAPGKDDAAWDAELAPLRQAGTLPPNVVLLTATGDDPAGPLRSAVPLVRALERHATGPTELVVVTHGACDVHGDEAADPAQAAAHVVTRLLHQESALLRARGVDLAAPRPGDKDRETARLAAELDAEDAPAVVALRGGRRWTRRFTPAPAPAAESPAWRQGGVYVIIGGQGFFGRAAARHLMSRLGAHVVLLDDRVASDDLGLPDIGGTHETITCDAADEKALGKALAEVQERRGRIDAVFFAAGPPAAAGVGELGALSDGALAPHVHARVEGLTALDAALEGLDVGACVVVSSLATVLGGVASAAYTATTLWAEAYAGRARPDTATRWSVVNWEHWRRPGEVSLGAARDRYALDPEELAETVEAALRHDLPHLAVSTAPLDARVQRARTARATSPAVPEPADAEPGAGDDGGLHRRPSMTTPFVAPRDEREQFVADNMAQLLGIDRVGTQDSFFDELGGDSLMAMQLISRVRDHYRIDLPMSDLFEEATAAALAAKVAHYTDGTTTAEPDPGSDGDDVDALLAEASPEELARLLAEMEDGA
ncbi:SDR family NAD(P)-dependent oxidoreductase [Streptomyces sp. NPDC049687]|uniref:type I polyketide synthase n=1 Tax=Streptomyces sp. NPDC049687 TaxID=3365596 RepID=UPI0037AFA202